MINPDEKAILAELITLRTRLERRPDSWVRLERVGRCLHWLGNPGAETYCRQAAANYEMRE